MIITVGNTGMSADDSCWGKMRKSNMSQTKIGKKVRVDEKF